MENNLPKSGLPASGSIVSAASGQRTASRWAIALLIAGLGWHAGAGLAQEGVRLPDMGGADPRVLPRDQERTFPSDFERYLRFEGLLVEDPIVRSYFEDMGHRLASHSDRRDRDFHFFLLRVPGINAFAAPAGVIGLNAGLILAAETEHEVAGVVAHEIAHVTQNHLARSMEEAQRVSIPVMLATLGVVLAGGISGSMGAETAQGILASGTGLAHQLQINYTRQNETEADRIGIALMARAGYDPLGMADFFQTLNRTSRAMGQGPPEYLRTHPLTVSRVAEAKERAERIRVVRLRDDEMFYYAQARLRVLMETQPARVVEFFETRLEQGDRTESATRYGLALGLIRMARYEDADREVQWLLNHDPKRQTYQLLQAELLLARDRVEEALELLDRLHHAYGQSELVTLTYAEALLREDDPARAARAAGMLRAQMRRTPRNVQVSDLLARAANRAGDPVRSAEAVAENYYLRGGLPEAIEQLERLIRNQDLDYYQRARISARLEELRAEFERAGGHRSG